MSFKDKDFTVCCKENSPCYCVVSSIRNIFEDLKNMEERVHELSDHDERLHDLENMEIEQRLLNLEKHLNNNSKRPYKCPVCDGKRKELYTLPAGSCYESECKTCEGNGIVWG